MPQVAQFQLPTPGQKQQTQEPETQLPPGAPAVMQYQLPDSAQSTSPPPPDNSFSNGLTNIASGNEQANVDTAKGAVKGLLSTVRQVSGVDTSPIVKDQLAHAPAFAQDVAAEKTMLDSKTGLGGNLDQIKGNQMSQVISALIPVPGINEAVGAAKLAKAPGIAADIASAPNTLKNVTKGLMSLSQKTGPTTDAKAIQSLVESGALKAGNTAKATLQNTEALKDAIRTTSESLTSRLKAMDVKPTVQPEDLNGILQDAYKSIEKNLPPSQQGNAKTTTKWIFQKLIDNTPKQKNGDIFPEDLLAGRQATDHEVEMARGSQVFDPATETGYTTGLRAIRQGANRVVAAKAPDQGVQEALAHQTSLYNVLENVVAKGRGAVKNAEDVSKMTGIKGQMAKHPLITELVKYGLGASTAGALAGEAASHAFNQ